MRSPLSEQEKIDARNMLLELLKLPYFNGNKLAEALGIAFQVLSRRKKDGAFSSANFYRLRLLHTHHVLKDFSTTRLTPYELMAIQNDAVARYREALKTQITARLGKMFSEYTRCRICKIIDNTQLTQPNASSNSTDRRKDGKNAANSPN